MAQLLGYKIQKIYTVEGVKFQTLQHHQGVADTLLSEHESYGEAEDQVKEYVHRDRERANPAQDQLFDEHPIG